MCYVIAKQGRDMPEVHASNIKNINITAQSNVVPDIGMNTIKEFLAEQNIDIISEIRNFADLSVLKTQNNLKIAVKISSGQMYDRICLPESQFCGEMAADIYVIIKVDAIMKKAEMIGFTEYADIMNGNASANYASISLSELKPIQQLHQVITEKAAVFCENKISEQTKEKPENIALENNEKPHEKAKELFFAYIEKRISDENKNFLISHVTSCEACNQEFNHCIELDNILKISADKFKHSTEAKVYFGEKEEKSEKQKKFRNKNIKRALNTAGKLALIGGAAYFGTKAALASQATDAAAKLAWVSVAKAGELTGVLAGTLAKTVNASIQTEDESIPFYDDDYSDSSSNFSSDEDSFENSFAEEDKDYDNSETFFDEELLDLFADAKQENDKKADKAKPDYIEEFVANDIIDNDYSFNAKEEFADIVDNEPEFFNLHEEDQNIHDSLQAVKITHDLQHKDLSNRVAEIAVEASKEKEAENFEDVEIISDLEDVLASFDDVEVVESLDFLDFSEEENQTIKEEAPQTHNPGISLNKEMLIEEMYENVESIPEEYKGLKFEHNYEKQEIFAENPDFAASDAEKAEELSLRNNEEESNQGIYYISNEHEDYEDTRRQKSEKKPLTGAVAAGIAVTLAIALWLNHKPQDGQVPQTNNLAANSSVQKQDNFVKGPENLPFENPDSTEEEQKKSNSEHRRHREPLRSYSREVESSAEPVRNLDAVLAEAFTRRTYEVNIRNIAWQVPEDMAANVVFKNYIMVTGQALKSALARDLASAKEHATSSKIEIATIMDTRGNLLQTKIAKSSGSSEVDKICMETFKTTIQFTKLPKIYVDRNKINANMIISF
jgi:hypothetical protein